MVESYKADTEMKAYAGIGVVCLQWALLEHNMLRVIACAEGSPIEKVFLFHGGLDMLPRINLALKTARYEKWPQRLVNRIEAIRTEIQGKRQNGLQMRRNQLVHGAHKKSEKPDSVSLTMVRYEGDKRTQDVSLTEIYELAASLHRLSEEAWRIADDYGVWKFGPRREENSNEQFIKAEPPIWLKIMENAKGVIKRLFG